MSLNEPTDFLSHCQSKSCEEANRLSGGKRAFDENFEPRLLIRL